MKRTTKDTQHRKDAFLNESNVKHKGKFDYSLVVYTNNHTPVTIICPIHGKFKQRPANHLSSKEGCYQCGKNRAGKNHRLTKEEFISRAQDFHGTFYDYSLVEYVDSFTPVKIICPKHGEFKQQPNDHMFHGNGCKKCGYENRMSIGEQKIERFLQKCNMEFFSQYTFEDLRADDGKNLLRYDFCIPSQKLLIEFDGPHHERPITYKGTTIQNATLTHEKTKKYDRKKKEYASKNGYFLLRIPYSKIKEVDRILTLHLTQ